MPAHERHPHRRPRAARGLLLLALAVLALGACASASAQTVYKCSGAHGQLIFQDAPCAKDLHQRVLHLHVPAPPPGVSAASSPVSAPAAPAPAPTVAAAPAAAPARTYRIPQLYQCVRATDGKAYVSRNGHPPAYRVPLGILGAFQMPLAQTYGGPDATRRAASDPTLAHGRITPGLVAGHYTWVRDRCRPMRVDEICAHLGRRLEQTESAIDKAFQSDRPPLQRKADTLRSEMAGCRR